MIRQIAPQFFTTDIPATLAYYKHTLGFECLGTWQDPPVYAIVARDQHAIHFRCAEPPTGNPDNIRTNCSMPTCSSKTQTHFTPSMQPKASNSLENSKTCRGVHVSSWRRTATAVCS